MNPDQSEAPKGQLAAVPRQPPLDIVRQGGVWLVTEHHRGSREGEVFSTHDSQIDAVRASKTKMENDSHPCTLRWDSPHSVGNLYWNPLFECLDVRYDDLLDVWTVVPEEGTCAIATSQSRQAGYELGKRIQYAYDFKHLRAYDESTSEYGTRDHRFLRHDITRSGVEFDPTAFSPPGDTGESPADESEPSPSSEQEETYVGPATPGQLGVSLPDVTEIEFVDTDGALHRYATPWGDGTDAELLALSRKYTDNARIRNSLDEWIPRWRAVDGHPNVATVYESGTDPVPWLAYQVGERTLETAGVDLSVQRRLSALDQIGTAITALRTADDDPIYGFHPGWIYLHPAGGNERVTVALQGLKWAVQRSVGTHNPTPYTAPEQLDGEVTRTTAVYQFGAVAYYLLCESPPITDGDDIAGAIEAGEIPPANPTAPVPADAGSVVERCLETDPAKRYNSVEAASEALRNTL